MHRVWGGFVSNMFMLLSHSLRSLPCSLPHPPHTHTLFPPPLRTLRTLHPIQYFVGPPLPSFADRNMRYADVSASTFHYIVTEYLEGDHLLQSLIGNQGYCENDARATVRTIAKALSYCHARGVVRQTETETGRHREEERERERGRETERERD